MRGFLGKFERAVVVSLIGMMVIVVILATIELGWIIVRDIITPPIILLEIEELLEIFGFFLLVLIGIELLECAYSAPPAASHGPWRGLF